MVYTHIVLGGLGSWVSQIGERLKDIREYRGLSQSTVAEWFDMTKQAWGRKERGEIKGFSPDDFVIFLEKTQVDARWLFGQMEGPIQDADLRTRRDEPKYGELVQQIKELRDQVGATSKDDPVAHRVAINQSLREHVQMIQFLDAGMINKINIMVYGYLQGNKDRAAVDAEAPQREPAADGKAV